MKTKIALGCYMILVLTSGALTQKADSSRSRARAKEVSEVPTVSADSSRSRAWAEEISEVPTVAQVKSIDGIYRFVSETTTLEAPDKKKVERGASDWKGLWIFGKGYFSRTLMKEKRSFNDLSPEAIGYESDAGTFKIDAGTVILYPEMTLYPIASYYRPLEFQFSVERSTLILTRTMRPYMEDLSSGRQTIVLERTP
jgi:hypothetical protein